MAVQARLPSGSAAEPSQESESCTQRVSLCQLLRIIAEKWRTDILGCTRVHGIKQRRELC